LCHKTEEDGQEDLLMVNKIFPLTVNKLLPNFSTAVLICENTVVMKNKIIFQKQFIFQEQKG